VASFRPAKLLPAFPVSGAGPADVAFRDRETSPTEVLAAPESPERPSVGFRKEKGPLAVYGFVRTVWAAWRATP